jgi:UDP-N-acetylmuramate dehydrogenase
VQTDRFDKLTAGLKERLVALLGKRVKFAESLSRHTSFRIGGPADALVEPQNIEELQDLLSFLHLHQIPTFVLGGGTNLLASDKGVRGVVIKLGRGFSFSQWCEKGERARVRVGATRSFGRFVREAVKKGYGGVEFAEGIPGTVGGGLLMNAGAFGGEMSKVVEAIDGVKEEGTCARLFVGANGGSPEKEAHGHAPLHFHYRRAEAPKGFVVTAVEFLLPRADTEELFAAMHNAQMRRRQSQPYGYANAGSIFKNPQGDFAGRLIEAVGLKGTGCGRARVSERHANFIVNTGGATAAEVKALMDTVQKTVWEKKGVWLEPEVRLVGEW